VLPPHGDPIVESAPAPAATSRDDSLPDFDMPVIGEPARVAAADAERAPGQSGDAAASDREAPTIPTELPPEVIAAEAVLVGEDGATESEQADVAASEGGDAESVGGDLSFIDVGEVTEPATAGAAVADEPSAEPDVAEPKADAPAATAHRPFVTETMAELYLKQGFRQEALAVYEQLSSAAPGDERLSAKVASLRADSAAPARASGPAARTFFASIAARRPGERAIGSAPPSDDDFGPSADDESSDPPAAPGAAHAADVTDDAQTPTVSAPAEQRPGGSIDALFGNRPSRGSEDSAASALAQAFGSGGDATPLAGNPTRPATGELTLDSVFREGSRPPRTSQGFSFDQFFSQNVEGDKTSGGGRNSQEVPAAGEPAERNEDDIEQFNSWLQGLKQR
jgi:hypothetical protein